jgi:alkylated DNA repair dioxygenase AlkB
MSEDVMSEDVMSEDVMSEEAEGEHPRKRWQLSESAWITYEPHFLSDEEAEALMSALVETEEWEQRAIQVFGSAVNQPRLMSWGGELPYRYSGQTLPPRAPSDLLKTLWERVEAACGHSFNHVLLNYYRDGRDHMGMHADDEAELGQDPLIAAISLGVTRRFVIEPKRRERREEKGRDGRRGRRRKSPEGRQTLLLHHGSLMVMGGDMQHTWRHGVPKMGARETSGPRINITFRTLLGLPGEVPRPRRHPRPEPLSDGPI